jgi:serine/threonine protein kinase
MPLSAGEKLGPYEILAPMGAGGMGEVYRAKDTKLKREVALKVLPDSFAGDRDSQLQLGHNQQCSFFSPNPLRRTSRGRRIVRHRMSLAPGTRLGPFEILAPIGAVA